MDQSGLPGAAQFEAAVFWQPVDDWTGLRDRAIEVHEQGLIIDRGTVDSVTADGRILWLTFDGARHRRLVEKLPGRYLRLLP